MKNAIILHGMPSKEEYYNPQSASESNKHWIPWIQKQLLLHDIIAQTPELPLPFNPVYEKWLGVFNQFTVNEDTLLIGHSCGAGFLVRWLNEHTTRVNKVALVAPFLDPNRMLPSGFFNFDIKHNLSRHTQDMRIFYSTDDVPEIITSVTQLQNADNKITTQTFTDKGHFTFNDMKTEQFPELAEFLI